MLKVGIDVGGTFTDLVAVDDAGHSTLRNPSGRAIKTRIRAVMRHHRRGAAVSGAGFPLPFGVPALASRVILFPLRS